MGPPILLTLQLRLRELCALQLSQEQVRAALQVRARHVELHVGHQLLEAGEARGLVEVLRVLVQPGAQDGGDGTGRGAAESKAWLPLHAALPWPVRAGLWARPCPSRGQSPCPPHWAVQAGADEVGPGVSRALPHHLSRAPGQGRGQQGWAGCGEDGSFRGASSGSPASLCSLGPRAHPQLPTLSLLQEPSGAREAGARVLPTPQPRPQRSPRGDEALPGPSALTSSGGPGARRPRGRTGGCIRI